jgi:hypothetical protein
MKSLGRWIEMVELEHLLAACVAADNAFTTSLFNQRSLDDTPSLCHGFRPAADATVVPAALQHELSLPMMPALHIRPLGVSGRISPPSATSLELMASQPVANGRHAPSCLSGHLLKREICFHEGFQSSLLERSFRGMQPSAVRPQRVLLQPSN